MQREHLGVRRIVLKRNKEHLVPCQFAELEDRLQNVLGSCGALIPFAPRKPCPNCGQRQINAHAPAPKPDSLVIEGNAAIVDEESDRIVAVQAVVATDLAHRLAEECRAIHWDGPVNNMNKPTAEARLSGIIVSHRTFGFVAPVPLRRRYGCSRSRFDFDYPNARQIIDEMCQVSEHVFRTQAESVYEETTQVVRDSIASAWLMAGTPWTSGIINNTAALPYHRDSGNIKGSWSAMLASRRNIDGGLLHLADYDAYLAVPNGSISIFDGQSVLHGVTPFRPTGPNAYRYTVVCYAKSGMKACCADPAQEARRAALRATEAVERRRDATR